MRGRLGYVLDSRWLIYGTGGFAFAYDKLQRNQIAGASLGGAAQPDTFQTALMWRLGWTLGAGIEVPIAPNWTAKLEYQYAAFGDSTAAFPDGAQRFTSNLALQSVRLGMNYQIGEGAKWGNVLASGPTAIDLDRFNLHGQLTFVSQSVPQFRSPYVGQNSLIPNQGRETSDITFYVGMRLWQGAEFWINPEIDQGFGIGNTLGVAGFTSGEAYKLGEDYPYARIPRAIIRANHQSRGRACRKSRLASISSRGRRPSTELVITVGKFSVADIFDTNRYAHDPRSDFLNWSLIDTGTFDYAADAWGYTYGGGRANGTGASGPCAQACSICRLCLTASRLIPGFAQFQSIVRTRAPACALGRNPARSPSPAVLSRGRMGSFDDAVSLGAGSPASRPTSRPCVAIRSRSGISMNLEQQMTPDSACSPAPGLPTATTSSLTSSPISIAPRRPVPCSSGKRWGRPDDVWGVGGIVNDISTSHQIFLNAGGLGILVGDGQLPHPGLEQIIETYYRFAASTLGT